MDNVDQVDIREATAQLVFLIENDRLPVSFTDNIITRLHQTQEEIDQIKREYTGRERWDNLQTGLEGIRVTFRSLYEKKEDVIMLEPDRQKEYLCDYFLDLLKTLPIKTCKDMFKLYKFSKDELNSGVGIGSEYYAFIIFGCPGITDGDGKKLPNSDVDVAVFVREEYIHNGVIKDLSKTEQMRLRSEIVLLGTFDTPYYLEDIKIDYCIMCIDDSGNIVASSKGGSETSRIIVSTHHLHKQKYIYGQDIPELILVPVLKGDKIKAIAKFIMDYLEFFCKDYQSIRDSKLEAYGSEESNLMIKFSASEIVRDRLDFDGEFIDDSSCLDSKKIRHLSNMKALCMKFIQLLLLEMDQYEYTKMGLSQKSRIIRSQIGYKGTDDDIVNETLYFLSRRRL